MPLPRASGRADDPNVSAFLIDRERHGVVLTDNISKDTSPMIIPVCDICDAIDSIAAIVSSARTAGTKSLGLPEPTAARSVPRR